MAQDVGVNKTGSDSGFPQKTDTLIVVGRGPFLVHRFILPGTESVWRNGIPVDTTYYRFNYAAGRIRLLGASDTTRTTLIVRYGFLPLSIRDTYTIWGLSRRDKRNDGINANRRDAQPRVRTLSRAPGLTLNRSGSITRGITTGSRRDIAVESGLKLQVNGKIAEGVNLRALLSDENTPILPEGTTQRLNEFDRVFIEISASRGAVQLGDIDGRFDTGRFGILNRKLQGASLNVVIPEDGGGFFRGATVTAAGASSRGVFRSQTIPAVDGVQGPYRLEGDNNERFIIVIPGSEAVFLDGIRLTRGESKDYIIDYTTGEILFSPSRLITAERRITVEFQYTTNQFTRTLVASAFEARFGRSSGDAALLEIGASLIRESDGDQFSEEFALTAADSVTISQAGDSDAFRAGAVQVVYDPESLFTQYVQRIRVQPDGSTMPVFVALSSKPASGQSVFRVTFTRLGRGKGDYRRVGQSVNGIVYEFAGFQQGEYAPLRSLPKPVSQSLYNFTSIIRPVSGLQLSGEWASSRKDLNRLSSLDSSDDIGNAYIFSLSFEPEALSIGSKEIGQLRLSATRDYRNASFNTFERVRTIEFARDWNLRDRSLSPTGTLEKSASESIDRAEISLTSSDSSFVRGYISRLDLGMSFKGERLGGSLALRKRNIPQVLYSVSSVTSTDAVRGVRGLWMQQRLRLDHSLRGKKIRPYGEVNYERLRDRDISSSSVLIPSFSALSTTLGGLLDAGSFKLTTGLSRRAEERFLASGRKDSFTAWTLSSKTEYSSGPRFRGSAEVGYRQTSAPLGASDTGGLVTPTTTDELILRFSGRWRSKARKHSVNWLYQAQTERSATLQELYIRTGQERGEFVWIDDNGDGAVQLEEFIPETTPDEGEYVRTFIPSDSLESVTSVKGRMRWEYRNSGPGGKNGIRALFAGFGSTTLVDFEEKSRDPVRSRLYLLRLDRFRNSAYTLNGRIRVRQELSFFRNLPGRDLTFVVQESRSLTELSAGEDSKRTRLIQVRSAYRIHPEWTLRIQIDNLLDKTVSESFASRNFDISSISVRPTLSWTIRPPLTLSVSPTWSRKREQFSTAVATILEAPLEVRYRSQAKYDVVGRFELADVSLDKDLRGLSSFEMTDGRGAGTSALWRVSLQANLTEMLTGTFSYDGRAPSGAPVIHTARFQLSARF